MNALDLVNLCREAQAIRAARKTQRQRSGIPNAELARVVATLDHGQMLVIGDAGLPVPRNENGWVPRIDLPVRVGVPGFWAMCPGSRRRRDDRPRGAFKGRTGGAPTRC